MRCKALLYNPFLIKSMRDACDMGRHWSIGIADPLSDQIVSWKLLVLIGLIGGGPVFPETDVSIVTTFRQVFILFLALAAGAIVSVLAELLGQAKRFRSPELVM